MTYGIKKPKEIVYTKNGKSWAYHEDLINPARKKSNTKKAFIEELEHKETLSEKDVLLFKRRLNDKTYSTQDINELFENSPEGKKLSMEQQEKGRKWLVNQWKGKSGVERKNNPFGYREQNILDNFKEIRLTDFYDNVSYYQAQAGINNYIPIYRVIGKDGSSFEYYVAGGEIHITG